jgi:hypothetical protein
MLAFRISPNVRTCHVLGRGTVRKLQINNAPREEGAPDRSSSAYCGTAAQRTSVPTAKLTRVHASNWVCHTDSCSPLCTKAEPYGRREVGPKSWPENFCSIALAKAFSSIEQIFSDQKLVPKAPKPVATTFGSNFLSTESQKLGPTFGIPISIEQKLIPTFETNFLSTIRYSLSL